jgi:hypothetical protein
MVAVLQENCGRHPVLAETLLAFAEPVTSQAGAEFLARACGVESGHTWQGWIEFVPVDGGAIVRSGRETTQPSLDDLRYWATGLTHVYLEGALQRALEPLERPNVGHVSPPAYDGPAPDFFAAPPTTTESVLNPLSVYRKGEALLRAQLGALSAWHLVNIVRRYNLSGQSPEALTRLTMAELIELIVAATRMRIEAVNSR